MRAKSILSVTVLLFTSALYGAAENPNVGSPFKSRNAPASSGQRQRFITQQNIYGRIGNDIVTGNVGGGRHFRGVVPYGSSYYSSAYSSGSGTSSVNNFIRRSANPLVNDRNPGQIQPYYDPRRSVSSMSRPDGTSGLARPQLTGQGQTNPYVIPNSARMALTPLQQRPLSVNHIGLEEILARRQKLHEEALKQADPLEKETTRRKGFFDDALSPDLIQRPRQDEQKEQVQKSAEPEEDTTTIDPLTEDQAADAEQIPEQAPGTENQDQTQTINYASPKSDLVPKLDLEAIDTNKGRKVLGEHKTFESLAQEKFAGFMDAAEAFIKEGKFYKAADTYALAIVWKPNDARGYLGQSFSLFAAGEYMSSAYYLSRAFELDSNAAVKKYNLAEFVEDRDVFENRILELTTWQERSNSGELAFLLAYISYQDNKAVRAVNQIRKAKEAMPNSPAVAVLKNIIDPEKVLK